MPNTSRQGFTLTELLAVVGAVMILFLTFVSGMAKSGLGVKALQCRENHRRLVNAWRMYADDSLDRIVYSADDGTGSSNPLNQYAWTTTHLDFSPLNRGNWDINYELIKSPLWPYMGRDATVIRCPSDDSFVMVLGVARPRVRSVSMNLYLGGFVGSDGGWPFAGGYRIYQKTSEFSAVAGPADKIFVFLDMRPDLINWGNFLTDMTGYDPLNSASWQFSGDLPGMYHEGAATFSFVDGHCDTKPWLDPRTTPPPSTIWPLPAGYASPGNPDVYWLQDHSARKQ